ncbi:MAG TPA: ATP-binding protein [Candidatus Acidoferrales bacterium]|nr:ATP-binding protein [Candidatus Acidoferrales bacterium]
MGDEGSLSQLYLRQSPACQWITGADGRFVRVFGDSCSLFGCGPEDLRDRDLPSLLSAEQAAQWRVRFQRVLAGETLVLSERRGQRSWNLTLFPLRVNGTCRYVGGLGVEVTAWGTAELELRHTVLGALRAQEYMRSTVSRFLHDSVGQTLTALGLRLDLVRMDLDAVAPETCKRVAEIQEIIGEMMESVREYSYELNPSTVERAGLRPAVDRLLTRLRSRYAGALRANVDPSLKLDPKLAAALYQIAQEAMENAVQHASCSSVEISVKSTRTGTVLEVRDNGRGFDPADVAGGRRGLGLLSMEHYAAEAGLELAISSTLEGGTTVRAATPGAMEK